MTLSALIAPMLHILAFLWRASWQASILAALVLSLQTLLGTRISARLRYNLWMLVLLRLLLPAVPASRLSLHNLWPRLSPQSRLTAPSPNPAAGAPSAPASSTPIAIPNPPAPSVRAASSPPRRLHPATLLLLIWLAGAGFFLLRLIYLSRRLSGQMRHLRPVTDTAVLSLLHDCSIRFRLRTDPVLLTGSAIPTPALVGLWRPRLLLPLRVLHSFDHRNLRLIILHELGHLKRHDVAANWLLAAVQVIHWFNPLLWAAFARIRADRELACDELVLRAADSDRSAYGQVIIRLLETLLPGQSLPGTVGILEDKHQLKRRIAMVARFDRKGWTWFLVALLCGLVPASGAALTDAADDVKPPARVQDNAIPKAEADKPDAKPATMDEQLARRIPEVRFEGVALSDAIDFLRDVSGLNFTVQWKALQEAGIGKETPVTVKLRGVALGQVIDLILRSTGGAGRLTYGVDQNVIVISTTDNLPKTAIHPAPAKGNDKELAIQIARRLPEIRFDAVAFGDVLDFLRDVTGMNIFPDWIALHAAGIDHQTPVSARFRDVAFGKAMELILADLGPRGTRATYAVEGNVLIITATATKVEKMPGAVR